MIEKENEKSIPPSMPKGEEDLEERVKGFNKEVAPLYGKYELGLGAVPLITRDGRLSAQPLLVSMRQAKQEAQAKNSELVKPE